MELKTYLTTNRADVDRLAADSGTAAVYLRQIAYGHRQASPELTLAIAAATGGLVRPYDLRPDIYPDPDWAPPPSWRRTPKGV